MTVAADSGTATAARAATADLLAPSLGLARTLLAGAGDNAASRERLVSFQTLLADFAAEFAGLDGAGHGAALERLLGALAAFTGADRAVLLERDAGAEERVVTQSWSGGEAPRRAGAWPSLSLAPWSIELLRRAAALRFRDRSELPAEAVAEAEAWESLGLRSVLALSVPDAGGAPLALALFVTLTAPADWSDHDLAMLHSAAPLLRGALENKARRIRLDSSELKLRKLLESGAVGILVADREGCLWEANDVALLVVGADREALEAGRLRWDELTPPEYRPMTMGALEQLEQSGCSQPWEQDVYRPDGSRVSILVCAARIAEYPDRFLLFAVDTTNDKKAQRVLARRNRLSRLVTLFSTRLIAVAPDRLGETIEEALREVGGVLGLDRCTVWIDVEGKGTYSRCRHVWDREKKFSASIRIPGIDRSLFPRWQADFDNRRPMLVKDVERELPEHSPERAFLATHQVRSGIAVPLVGSASPLGFATFAAGRVIDWPEATVSLLCVIGEIFASAIERVRIEEKQRLVHAELEVRIAERTRQLEGANRELEAFSYAVSHDLRAPLRSVDGFSRILVEDHSEGLPVEAKGILGRVRATSQRMGELIDALLRLSRITRSAPQFEKIDLSQAARETAAALAAAEPERLVDFDIEDGMLVEGEPGLLRALVDNLLRNAWKFTGTRPHAHIAFGRQTDESGAVYFVRDDGVGFENSQATRLFMPFQRLHDPGEFEGHGVGLATVKRIVTLHGGKVWGTGDPGKGATISFTLHDGERAAN